MIIYLGYKVFECYFQQHVMSSLTALLISITVTVQHVLELYDAQHALSTTALDSRYGSGLKLITGQLQKCLYYSN